MASSYPTSLDAFTNPTSGDNLDSPDHATQHADVNDAVEALEAKVGTGSGTPTTGRVLKGGGTAGSSEWADDVPVSDGTLSVGDLVTVKSLSPLVVEGVPNGTYLAVADDIGLSPGDAIITSGSPAPGAASTLFGYMAFDAAAGEAVAFWVPSDRLANVDTFDIVLKWVNAGAGSGNVVWRCTYGFYGDGDNISTGVTNSDTTAAAQSQDVVEETTLVSGLSPTAGKSLGIVLRRLGANGSDTLGNDAGMVELVVRPT